MQIYKNIGYDAVGIGPLDMAAGIEILKASAADDFPWVSANILDNQNTPLFQQWISKNIQGVEVVVTALTAPPKKFPPTLKVAPWESVLPGVMQKLTKEGTHPFIILLSTLSTEENRLIAEQYPAINLLLGAGQHLRNASPRLINNTLVTQTEKQGQYQGLLEISFGNQRTWGQNREKQIADLQNRLGSLNWQLKRLEKNQQPAHQKKSTRALLNDYTKTGKKLMLKSLHCKVQVQRQTLPIESTISINTVSLD